ncbi:MAG TPA: 30S ribosomal protein S4 [bacterium]|nr:30S ribosomal protein S4 [bacterium]
MSRYTEAKCRLCRREGAKLFLKGEKCSSVKCILEKRKAAPGQHGITRVRFSEYRLRLREKQKARRIYGISETQFRNYFELASKRKGVTGETLLQLLERRLDNVLYRLGFAASRSQARQLIAHGHVLVNGKKLDIPSYLVKPGDRIALKGKIMSGDLGETLKERVTEVRLPSWLEVNSDQLEGMVRSLPSRQEIDIPVNEQLIVEFYSR